MPESLKIISFNLGLLDLKLASIFKISPAKGVEKRLDKIIPSLRKEKADILAVQELYDSKHCFKVIKNLQDIYPYNTYKISTKKTIKIGNGLVLFSKFPIDSFELISLVSNPWDEAVFAQKYLLCTKILINKIIVGVVNVHLTAGGILRAQNAKKIIEIRKNQIRQVIKVAESCATDLSIILGDFNAGPEVASENYNYLTQRDYVDLYLSYCLKKKIIPSITWDSGNILNIEGTHATSISQRIDHIFLSKKALKYISLSKAQVLFKEPVVLLEKQHVTLSDHYGVMVALKLK